MRIRLGPATGLVLLAMSASIMLAFGFQHLAGEPKRPRTTYLQSIQLELHEAMPHATAGVLLPSGRHLYELRTPDGIDWANAYAGQRGLSWSVREGVSPDGATDSQEECEAATEEMCVDAGHGGVDPESVELTPHASGDGCTCSGDCLQNGAMAFVSSTGGCG